ncbi:MAG TPA: thiamine pyrophosphate-binding protein [Streptosporangiaceae bacterium]
MNVADTVGRVIAGLASDAARRAPSGQLSVDQAAPPLLAFGLVGSGNFHVTNGLIAGGARFVAARHEGGAAMMADGWARTTGRVGLLSLHQGPGLTNAMTGITEAAKSRTPLLVLVAEATERRSNFYLDVAGLAASVGAVHERLRSPATAIADAARAYRTALDRHTVIFSLPLDVQAATCEWTEPPRAPATYAAAPSREAVHALVASLQAARRPVFIAGRGARAVGTGSGRQGDPAERPLALETLADACGALLATSAAAKGLFAGNPWSLDVSGGFASPLAAELIGGADLIVAWGCALNMWTTRHSTLIGPHARVIQVDDDPAAFGLHGHAQLGLLGDVALTAQAVADELASVDRKPPSVMREKDLPREVYWRCVPYDDESDGQGTDARIDPRTLSIALDDMLPAERTVAVDSGNFMGYPSMYLSVPDEAGFCFTQAFQSVGLGLGSAIGAALARPDRLTVAALGDGGALMAVSELETLVRLDIPMVIVIYDDEAYGAEVHHFGPDGAPLGTVRFPPADIAAIGRGFGCEGVTVRRVEDLAAVRAWLDGPRSRPIVIDAKVTAAHGSWWLEEAFRGH